MTEPDEEGGYSYWVSDEQLRTFRAQTPERRLAWLEEMRELTYAMATEETRARWQRLRRGE